MLSKSAARNFFLLGTLVCAGAFLLLTVDTVKRIPAQTNEKNMTEQVVRGKTIWEKNNCMGCHTILGEGAYYAPELTKVYERRGPMFIRQMLKDPQVMYPGERKMVRYNMSDSDADAVVAFLKWIGEMDLNGFPPKPSLGQPAPESAVAAPAAATLTAVSASAPQRPAVFGQVCVACHALGGVGGNVGPALDGVGSRLTRESILARLKDPASVQADSKMPKLPLAEQDMNELANYLSSLKGGVK